MAPLQRFRWTEQVSVPVDHSSPSEAAERRLSAVLVVCV